MIWGNGVNMAVSFPCFPRETGYGESGKYHFRHRTYIGETGRQGEYIYFSIYSPFPQFPRCATGVWGLKSLRIFPVLQKGGVL